MRPQQQSPRRKPPSTERTAVRAIIAEAQDSSDAYAAAAASPAAMTIGASLDDDAFCERVTVSVAAPERENEAVGEIVALVDAAMTIGASLDDDAFCE